MKMAIGALTQRERICAVSWLGHCVLQSRPHGACSHPAPVPARGMCHLSSSGCCWWGGKSPKSFDNADFFFPGIVILLEAVREARTHGSDIPCRQPEGYCISVIVFAC